MKGKRKKIIKPINPKKKYISCLLKIEEGFPYMESEKFTDADARIISPKRLSEVKIPNRR